MELGNLKADHITAGQRTYNKGTAVRFGIKIKKAESNPEKRVSYIYDAVGMTPAKMNYADGIFNYGSWKNVDFVKNNYPCMVKFDGTEDYKLSPTDYTLKADGTTASDVANVDYAGNAMAAFLGGWICQYETETDEYIIWSNEKYADAYNAYHRTAADGTIQAGFYRHIFTPSMIDGKARSISERDTIENLTAYEENTACKENGEKWGMCSWWQWNYIVAILKIMAKTEDLQDAYGLGNCSIRIPLKTGTLNGKGQFWGEEIGTKQVKVFHTEGFWGDKWERLSKMVCDHGTVKVLPYGEEDFTGKGYKPIYRFMFGDWKFGYVDKTVMTPYGRLPVAFNGNVGEYTTDGGVVDASIVSVPLVGGYCGVGLDCGACVNLSNTAEGAYWAFAPGLSCEMPVAAQQ